MGNSPKNHIISVSFISVSCRHIFYALYPLRKTKMRTKNNDILGGDQARRVLARLVQRAVITRLKPSLYRVIPFEHGFEREYLGIPYWVTRGIAVRRTDSKQADKQDYYLSHGSAFDLHQMITQPQLIAYVSSLRFIRNCVITGGVRLLPAKPPQSGAGQHTVLSCGGPLCGRKQKFVIHRRKSFTQNHG